MDVTHVIAKKGVPINQLAQNIRTAIDDGNAVELDVSDLSDPDLWTVQLIVSARRQAATRGVAFRLGAPATPILSDVLLRGGFLTDMPAADLNFWFKGESVQ